MNTLLVRIQNLRWLHIHLLILYLILTPEPSYASKNLVYQVKTSYIYNFLQFIQFPSDAFDNGYLSVCLLGKDNFGPVLDEINDAEIPGGKIALTRLGIYDKTVDYKTCRVIYLTLSEYENSEAILAQLDKTKVLTIGEFTPFINNGGLIELRQIQDNIRFRINKEQALIAEFRVAAQLLKLGTD